MGTTTVENGEALRDLTPKQVEVLDLLIQHKTTKEIARELDIAPNTVDQRIMGVRDKWGTLDRKETARLYATLVETCGKSPCGFPVLDRSAPEPTRPGRDLPVSSEFELQDADAYRHWSLPERRLAGLEAFDARFGKVGRVVLICGLAFALAATAILSLSIADSLSRLF